MHRVRIEDGIERLELADSGSVFHIDLTGDGTERTGKLRDRLARLHDHGRARRLATRFDGVQLRARRRWKRMPGEVEPLEGLALEVNALMTADARRAARRRRDVNALRRGIAAAAAAGRRRSRLRARGQADGQSSEQCNSIHWLTHTGS